MGLKEHYIKREELYEKVWNKPFTEIAKEYDVSDKAIAKICDKLNVPVPGVGYWQKLEAGEQLEKKKLPDIPPNFPTYHHLSKWTPNYDLEISEEAQSRINFEKDPANKIIVPDKRGRTHLLVKKTELTLSQSYRAKQFLSSSRDEGIFTLFVSKVGLNRAIRILDTLIKELEKREYLVYVNKNLLNVKVFGIELQFLLKEKTKRIEIKNERPTHFKEYDFLPSGVLLLSIENLYIDFKLQRNFEDIKSAKLEDRLNEFIISLIIASQAEIAHKKYSDEQKRIREEKERLEKERLESIEREFKKLKKLKKNVKKYHQSTLIREYVERYKQKLNDEKISGEDRKEIEEYIKWALEQADRIDPFVESPASILDNRKKKKKSKNKAFGSSSLFTNW